MIAAEILIAPRSPDAPAATPQAARPSDGADFAQVLAQTLPQTTKATPATADAAVTGAEGLALPVDVADTAPGPASALLLADRTAVALPAGTTPAAAGDVAATAPDAGKTGAAPADAPAPDAALTGTTLTPETPDAAATPTGPDGAQPDSATPSGTVPPSAPRSDAATAEAATAPKQSEPPAEDTASDPEPEPQPEAGAQDAAPASAATPPALPPLATLIQPLIAPLSAKGADTAEPDDQAEVTGSTPRQRGMSGRLATLTETRTATPDSDPKTGPAFADRLALTGTAPQDRVPSPTDGTQAAPHDPLADSGTEAANVLPGTSQPLPLDTRASQPSPATPQRLPDTAPLDTTRSGWEAALTERITAHDTDLGQEIEISLTPENLGHIRIKLDLSDRSASVQIVTDTPQAAHLFQQSEARLADALNRAGLNLTSHDASARDPNARDPGARDGGQGGQRQGQGGGNPRAEAALAGLRGTLAPPTASGRAANLVNIVA